MCWLGQVTNLNALSSMLTSTLFSPKVPWEILWNVCLPYQVLCHQSSDLFWTFYEIIEVRLGEVSKVPFWFLQRYLCKGTFIKVPFLDLFWTFFGPFFCDLWVLLFVVLLALKQWKIPTNQNCIKTLTPPPSFQKVQSFPPMLLMIFPSWKWF